MELYPYNTLTHRPAVTIAVPLPVCWNPFLWSRGARSQSGPQLLNNINMTEFTLSHTTSDLLGDRSCFLHSISGNLISLQYIVLHANSMSTEREKN